MNPDIKAKWLAALKSGEYVKGKCCLRNTDNTYCCLGVLADLINPDGWTREDYMGHFNFNYALTSDGYCLLYPLQQEVGITNIEHADLTDLNDRRETWKEVIDYIDKRM